MIRFSKGLDSFKAIDGGGILTKHVGEGRLMPIIIINTGNNSKILDLIKAHEKGPAGDANYRWSMPIRFPWKEQKLNLEIEFTKPMKAHFAIEFEIQKDYILIDMVIQSRGFYLTTGKSGKDSNFTNGSIILDVPEMGFDKDWNKILLKTLISENMTKGVTKKDAKINAELHISEMRKILNFRMKR